jgi:hypothetical protein
MKGITQKNTSDMIADTATTDMTGTTTIAMKDARIADTITDNQKIQRFITLKKPGMPGFLLPAVSEKLTEKPLI